MKTLVAFAVGLVFALGLGISGMTRPEKVQGFLDFAGAWDASLLFVMGGAAITYFVFFHLLRGPSPVLAGSFDLPTNRQIDARLVVGSALFGAGWGLAGFCPGPAITSIGNGQASALLFVGAMVAGMLAFEFYQRLPLTLPAPGGTP